MLRLFTRLLLIWVLVLGIYCLVLAFTTPTYLRRLDAPLTVLLISVALLLILLIVYLRQRRGAIRPFRLPDHPSDLPTPFSADPPGDGDQRQQPIAGVRGKRFSVKPAPEQGYSSRRDPLHAALKHAEDVHDFQEDSQQRALKKLDK